MASSHQTNQRKGKGRQKIKIEKMENKSNMQVTFSKRRSGLFKKASELSTLTGAEVGVILFSPANKAYSFGHPNINTIIDKFQANTHQPSEEELDPTLKAQRDMAICCNNFEAARIEALIELERKRGEELDQIMRAGQCQSWFPGPIDELNQTELDNLKCAILKLQEDLETYGQKDTPRAITLGNPYVNEISPNLAFQTSKISNGPGPCFPSDAEFPVGSSIYTPPYSYRGSMFNTSLNPLGRGSVTFGSAATPGNSINVISDGQAMGENVASSSNGSKGCSGSGHF